MTLQDIVKNFKKMNVDSGSVGSQMDNAYRLYNNAILLIKVGRLTEARKELKDAVKRYPRFDEAYTLLGLTHFALGNRIESIRAINQISDGEKHNRAMKYYDMLDRDSEAAEEGTFTGAGEETGDERRARQLEKDNLERGEEGGDRETYVYKRDENGFRRERESGIVGDVIFELDEGIDFSNDDNAGRSITDSFAGPSKRKSDFDKRFAKAQKATDASYTFGRQTRGAAGDADGYGASSGRPDGAGTANVVFDDENDAAPGKASFDQRFRRAYTRAGKGPQPAQAGADAAQQDSDRRLRETSEHERAAAVAEVTIKPAETKKETPAETPSGKVPQRAVLAGLFIISIAVIALIAVIAVKAHRKYVANHTPEATLPVAATHTPSASTTADVTYTSNPFGTDEATYTPAPETPTPTEVPTDTPTPTPTPTPAPTEAPKTDAELAAEQAANLARIKTLFKEDTYYECYLEIINADWSRLDTSLVAEKDSLATKALAKFSYQYYNLMYANVAKENWQEVKKYGEIIIKYNPYYDLGAAVYFNVGKAYELLGDKDKAAEYYNITMTNYPKSDDASYASYRLYLITH